MYSDPWTREVGNAFDKLLEPPRKVRMLHCDCQTCELCGGKQQEGECEHGEDDKECKCFAVFRFWQDGMPADKNGPELPPIAMFDLPNHSTVSIDTVINLGIKYDEEYPTYEEFCCECK